MSQMTIAAVGNPNCGKTTVFNTLTGTRQRVGNWPGVTVERKVGTYREGDTDVSVVDLPGVYSLGVTSSASLDEAIARDCILSGEADVVLNIVDAANLERNMYLTVQLLEMGVPVVLALNMMDVARDRRIHVDVDALARELGCLVVPLVASRGEGVEHLVAALRTAVTERRPPGLSPVYSADAERAIERMVSTATPIAQAKGVDPRWLAIKLLEEDERVRDGLTVEQHAAVAAVARAITEEADEDTDILIADGRYGLAHRLVRASTRRIGEATRTVSDRIDRIVLNRVLGIPIFLAVMYLLFMVTINFAGAFIDFFDILVGTVLVDGVGAAMASVGSPEWLIALLAGGVGGGIQTVATFIPVIGFLYLFLSMLEDSGYMARAAFVMDRFMRGVGLPGKSFVPMIVGFGCNVPAIMATRTLEQRRDRVITVMMAPFMSCGARLPVYALFAAAFFSTGGQNLVFALYLIGIVFAMITGLVLKSTVLKGEAAPFVMELPPYHLPTVRGVLLRTWDRLKTFMFRAGKVIVAVVVVLSFLNSWGTDGSFGNEDTDRSVLAKMGRALTPVVEPMGIDEANWPATVGMLTGIFAKEAVVGTLDALYGSLAADDAGVATEEEAPFDLWSGVGDAFQSIPDNLFGIVATFAAPLGLDIGETTDIEAAAAEQEVAAGTFGAMVVRFDGQLGAFAYLLAVLLYMPCVAAVAAIYRETGAGWAVFASLWTTGLGYGAAVLTYQIGTYGRDPATATAWIVGILVVFAATVLGMRYYGARSIGRPATVPAE